MAVADRLGVDVFDGLFLYFLLRLLSLGLLSRSGFRSSGGSRSRSVLLLLGLGAG